MDQGNPPSSEPPIRDVFIAGAGHMGHGIAQVAATAGVNVTLYDVRPESLKGAVEKVRWSLSRLREKGRIAEEPDSVLARIRTSGELGAAAAAEMVIEAVPEVAQVKCELFAKLDAVCPPGVLFATNTSAIPITRLASATRRPGDFCGTHFFGPVPMLSLVEVIPGRSTSGRTLARATAFVRQIGKEPVVVRRDVAGFIVNRILGAAIGEAARLVEAGVADAAEVDKAMRLGCAWKMGPLETADLAGLDVVHHMFGAMQEDKPDPVLASPALLARLVAEGRLGRKSGRGFHDYPAPPK